ncbi:hypothetical protein WJX81_005912 [Elliptochloris bilobata]|uniref:Cyanobacterial aminoacyl-tRNA synthetase CAAD domain-containing protein n=1 Tax=Elliptochloris bilobata TaxID=381761 RepID=A0AAW1RNJ5_9CHLO
MILATAVPQAARLHTRGPQKPVTSARPAAPGARRGAPLRSYGKKTIDIDPEVRPSGAAPVVEFDADELSEKARAALDNAKRNWERLDEKPAAVALTLSVFVGLWATNAVVDAVNRIPLVSTFLEIVGLGVSGWFIYRYLVFKPDREELTSSLKDFWKKVSGKSNV